MGPACLRPWHRLQIYAVSSGYALAQVRQKWWGWEIIAAMTVNTSKIKNSDGSNEGNNHHAMPENMTHTPWRHGSSTKERKKGLNTRSWPISFGEFSPKMGLSYCPQIVSNSRANPRFGNKRINCCYGDIFCHGIFFWVFQIRFKIKAFTAYHQSYQATYWPH